MNAILLPYGALGVALTVFLPFLLYFFFVHQSNIGPFGRRVAWILFGIIFLAIWGMRRGDISEIGTYIYLGGILFVLASLIFDKSIHRYFGLSDFRKVARTGKEKRKRELLRDMHQLSEDWQNQLISDSKYNKEMKDLKDKFKKI